MKNVFLEKSYLCKLEPYFNIGVP